MLQAARQIEHRRVCASGAVAPRTLKHRCTQRRAVPCHRTRSYLVVGTPRSRLFDSLLHALRRRMRPRLRGHARCARQAAASTRVPSKAEHSSAHQRLQRDTWVHRHPPARSQKRGNALPPTHLCRMRDACVSRSTRATLCALGRPGQEFARAPTVHTNNQDAWAGTGATGCTTRRRHTTAPAHAGPSGVCATC